MMSFFIGEMFPLLADTTEPSGGVIQGVRLLCGIVGILLLVYLMAELTPKLAKLMDKLFGRKSGGEESPKAEEYTVLDPYEGEKNEKNGSSKGAEKKP